MDINAIVNQLKEVEDSLKKKDQIIDGLTKLNDRQKKAIDDRDKILDKIAEMCKLLKQGDAK